jgi:signal peptidase I
MIDDDSEAEVSAWRAPGGGVPQTSGDLRPAGMDLAPAVAEPARSGAAARLGALVRDAIEAVILAVLLFALLQLAVQNTVVDGASMLPNFVDQQRLLVDKVSYRWSDPKRGDVIVFHPPGGSSEDFIKRVVALPGEVVAIRDGLVYVDGRLLPEPYAPVRDHSAFAAYTVPPGQVFVLGDNRPASNDSRAWERALPRDQIVGKAWLSIWPRQTWGVISEDRPVPAADRHGS